MVRVKNIDKSLDFYCNKLGLKEIRRKGLLFAIEMENSGIVQKVVEGCKERGLLSFWFLSCPESFRIAPPLIITTNEIKISCTIILDVMDELIETS